MLELHSSSLASLNATGSGQFSDGTLTVNISSYTGSSFSWTSNIGVDSIFARTADGGEAEDYAPPSKGDSIAAGGSITGISFCYDFNPATPTPTMPDTAASFGGPAGGFGGLMLALLLIGGAAAALIISTSRRTSLVALSRGTSAHGIWSTTTTPRRRQR